MLERPASSGDDLPLMGGAVSFDRWCGQYQMRGFKLPDAPLTLGQQVPWVHLFLLRLRGDAFVMFIGVQY